MSGIEDLESDLPDRREPSDAVVRTLDYLRANPWVLESRRAA